MSADFTASLEHGLRAAAHQALAENRAFDGADALAVAAPVIQQAQEEIAQLRETNARLNRRCQAAESAALQNVKACVSAGLSFSRTLANWYALRLVDELRACLALCGEPIPGDSQAEAAKFYESHRRRITNTLPEPAEFQRWRGKQTQPKASARDA